MYRISIQIAAYNAGKYIVNCIKSVLADIDSSGLKSEIEIFITDDASTDDTFNQIYSCITSEYNFRVERNSQNLGVAMTRRFMAEETSAEYIVPFDADDIFIPGRLVRHVKLLDGNPDFAAVYGKSLALNDNKIMFNNGHYFSNFKVFEINCIPHGSAMLRRQNLLAAGNYMKPTKDGVELSVSCDHFMWQRLALTGKIHFEDKFNYVYRKHDQQMVQVNSNKYAYSKEYIADYFLKENHEQIEQLRAGQNVLFSTDKAPLLMQSLGYLNWIEKQNSTSEYNCKYAISAYHANTEDIGPAIDMAEIKLISGQLAETSSILNKISNKLKSSCATMKVIKLRKKLMTLLKRPDTEIKKIDQLLNKASQLYRGTPELYKEIVLQVKEFI